MNETTNRKLVEEIERWRKRLEEVPSITITFLSSSNCLDTIIAALKAMDELPLSRDGVRITPQTKLWHPLDVKNGTMSPVTGSWLVQQKENPPYGNYFSTLEAAIAASQKIRGSDDMRGAPSRDGQ